MPTNAPTRSAKTKLRTDCKSTCTKPIPGWKFNSTVPDKSENLAELCWQIAPNGVLYQLGQFEFSHVPEGRLQVTIGEKYGYVDLSGDLVIPAIYAEAKSFSGGFALVRRTMNGPVEIIDRAGKLIDTLPSNMQPKAKESWSEWESVNGDGLVEVLAENDSDKSASKRGIYSIKRRTLLPMPENYRVDWFYDGMARVEVRAKSFMKTYPLSQFGFMNKQGEIVIQPVLDFAGRYGNGLAPVFSQKENRWYYIDRTGKELIKLPANCCLAVDFNDGRAAILIHPDGSPGGRTRKRGDRFGFIDTQGKQVIPAKFYAGEGQFPRFSNGLCAVCPGDDFLHYYGYIDKAGSWVIPPKYRQASSFDSPDVAAVFVGATEFSKEGWTREAEKGDSRVKLFQLFLHQHKLVGLDKTELLSYLGPSDGDFQKDKNLNYRLEGSCVGDLIVAIECEGEKVKRYRYNIMPAGEWFDISHPDKGDWPISGPSPF